jgi:hypothetical protein
MPPRSSWARSGVKAAGRPRDPRPEGSFGLAVDRARRWWDDLAGGPAGECAHGYKGGPCPSGCSLPRYSDVAAAAILSTAVALWADAAASMAAAGVDEI